MSHCCHSVTMLMGIIIQFVSSSENLQIIWPVCVSLYIDVRYPHHTHPHSWVSVIFSYSVRCPSHICSALKLTRTSLPSHVSLQGTHLLLGIRKMAARRRRFVRPSSAMSIELAPMDISSSSSLALPAPPGPQRACRPLRYCLRRLVDPVFPVALSSSHADREDAAGARSIGDWDFCVEALPPPPEGEPEAQYAEHPA